MTSSVPPEITRRLDDHRNALAFTHAVSAGNHTTALNLYLGLDDDARAALTIALAAQSAGHALAAQSAGHALAALAAQTGRPVDKVSDKELDRYFRRKMNALAAA